MSRSQFYCRALAICLYLGPLGEEPYAHAEETAAGVLDAALQRAEAIQSGKLEYQYEVGLMEGNAVPPTRGFKRIATFVGDSWIRRTPDGKHAKLHCQGLAVRFNATQQCDGGTSMLAIIEPSSEPSSRTSENRTPTFAGTFWNDRQLAFVKSHRRQVRRTGSANVAGVTCDVLALAIDPDQVAQVVPFALPSLARGAELRMNVAPDLGFAMPLIEIADVDGNAVVSYASSDFAQFPSGISFPRETRMEVQLANGKRQFERFSITPLAFNDSGLLDELVIQFPAGTTVLDHRDSGTGQRIDLSSAKTSVDLLGIPRELVRSKSRFGANGRAFIAAIVLGITGLIALMFLYARRQRQARHN